MSPQADVSTATTTATTTTSPPPPPSGGATESSADHAANALQVESSPDEQEDMLEQPDPETTQPNAALPVQKRRRVTRACDECRRKKIKCDGKQPCTHCTVYSYECTYDQPSTRRRNPAPQYIEALESRLHKAETLLRAVLPGVDLTDPRFDDCDVDEILSSVRKDSETATTTTPETENQPEQCEESLLESMVDNTGSLDLDDSGHWDYHGHSSGLIFVQRLRKRFGDVVPEPKPPSLKFQQVSHYLEASKSSSESPVDSHPPPLHDLPPRSVARQLCTNALEDTCCIMRFIHKPTFYAMFDRIYDTPQEDFTNEENTFLPLLYLALAAGSLFRGIGDSSLEKSGYESALHEGFQYFKVGRQLLDITECRDLTSLQAICFMILFLQSSANLSTCYSYIGIALRAAVRLGLHRSVSTHFNPVELETRKRVFWIVRKMDVHVSTIIGLPTMLSEEDIDQEYPLPIEDEYITPSGVMPMPPNHVSMMAGVNAHMRLTHIVLKVVKYIYPVKAANPGSNHSYMVSHSKIRDIERDLQSWMEALPDAFRPGAETTPDIERMRQLLRIGYAHVQMILYRPFLHYVTGNSQGKRVDKRSYACAAACISVARNVVHITAGLKKKQLLNGSYWFTMYTTHSAILSLLYFILENPNSATTKDGVLKDALEGKNALSGLAKRSMAADRCTQSLNAIFKHLPERLRNGQAPTTPYVNRKRTQPAQPKSPTLRGSQTAPEASNATESPTHRTLQRASSFPTHPDLNTTNQRTQFNSQAPGGTAVNVQNFSNRPQRWLVNEHSPLAISQSASSEPSLTDGDMMQGSSSPSSMSISQRQPQPQQSQQQQQQKQQKGQSYSNLQNEMSFSPPHTSANRLPDLMPMMFPSDDPLAYPNQPMSTLEDDHFKQDPSGTPEHLAFGQPPSMPTAMMSNSALLGTSSPTTSYGEGHGAASLREQNPNASNASLPQLNTSPQFPNLQEAMSSSAEARRRHAHARTSSDIVTMTNQPLMWRDLDSQQLYSNQNVQVSSSSSSTHASSATLPSNGGGAEMGFGMPSFEGLGMGMGMGMNMNMNTGLGTEMDLDDLFRTTGVDTHTGSGDFTADWTQWGGLGMDDPEN